MKLDLHVHTSASCDCSSDINRVIERAEEIGLDAIAITDHDSLGSIEQALAISTEVTIIPGIELTASGGAHILGLFIKNEIRSKNIIDMIDEIHEQDGLAIVAHPYRPGTGLFFNRDRLNHYSGDEIIKVLSKVDLVEAINYRANFEELNETAQYLSMHPDLLHTAGSDAHRIEEIGKAYVDLTDFETDNLEQIRNALLANERTFRFEAYTADHKIRSIEIKQKQKSLLVKSGNKVKKNLISPLKSIFSVRRNQPSNIKSGEELTEFEDNELTDK